MGHSIMVSVESDSDKLKENISFVKHHTVYLIQWRKGRMSQL